MSLDRTSAATLRAEEPSLGAARPEPPWPRSEGGANWRLVAECPPATAGGRAILVYENAVEGDRLYVEGQAIQSHALPGGESLVPYAQAIRELMRRSGARRIAVLGGAGGTLATMMTRPGGAACVLVDINPHAFVVAREYFWLSPAVECVVADARDYLAQGGEDAAPFDAIVLDVYDDRGRIPPHLAEPAFFKLARRRLASRGLLVANAFGEHGDDRIPDDLAAAMMAAGFPATILDGEDDEDRPRNALVVGGPFFAGWLPLPGEQPLGIWESEEHFRRCRPPRR
jgi:hypothetical protein